MSHLESDPFFKFPRASCAMTPPRLLWLAGVSVSSEKAS